MRHLGLHLSYFALRLRPLGQEEPQLPYHRLINGVPEARPPPAS